MLLRRVAAAVVMGLLITVLLAGDASADRRRLQILPSYMWGDPDWPECTKLAGGGPAVMGSVTEAASGYGHVAAKGSNQLLSGNGSARACRGCRARVGAVEPAPRIRIGLLRSTLLVRR
jgi:hypothetical protein